MSNRWLGLAVVALAQLMVVLDTTIVTIALPAVQTGLGMSDVDRQWTVTAYTLAFGGLLLLGGRIADRYGRKRTLIVGTLGFAVASVLGGVAGGAVMLVAARAAQGMFAAVLAPSTMSLLVTMFTDGRERAKAFGVFSAVLISGGALGLILGGVFTEYLSWRWCLYVNVPIAVVAAVGVALVVPNVPGRAARLDVRGAVIGGLGLAALVYGLGQSSLPALGLAVVLGAVFVVVQRLLPPRVLADRSRVGALVSVALNFVGTFGMFLLVTYQLQTILRYSPVQAGVAFLPLMLASALSATQIVARLLPRVRPVVLIAPGLLLAAVGMAVLAMPETTYLGRILPAEILVGLGSGAIMLPSIMTATRDVDPADTGVVSALVSTCQQVGASVGTALLNAVAVSYVDRLGGYRVACLWGVGVLVVAALLAVVLIRPVAFGPRNPAYVGASGGREG